MKFFQVVILVVVLASPVMVAKLPNKAPGHSGSRKHTSSSKKQLKDPQRPNRSSGILGQGAPFTIRSSDASPALTYALAPEHLQASLLQGQRYVLSDAQEGQSQGYEGLGGYGGQSYGAGYDAAALQALLSASLQVQQDHQPVGLAQNYQPTPVEPYVPLIKAAVPIEEPQQEEPKVTKAVFHSKKQYTEEKEPEYKDYAAKYQFGYRVRDLHTGNDFGQMESRDGHYTQGHYHVLLPDGRLQNVQYWSDHSGFHAEVSYNGHAHH